MTHRNILEAAQRLASRYLDTAATRHVGARATNAELIAALGGPMPTRGSDPIAVLEQLAANGDRGVIASAGPRYFGFVTGGAVPVTVGADWIGSAWDQNACLFVSSPVASAIEDITAGWLLELLGLPRQSGVGFVTGAHMANFTCLAAARHEVLRRAGWNVEAQGLQRAPKIRIIAGGEVHISAVGAALSRVRDRRDRVDPGGRSRPHARGSLRGGHRQ